MAKKLPKLPFLFEVRLMVVGVGVGAEDGVMLEDDVILEDHNMFDDGQGTGAGDEFVIRGWRCTLNGRQLWHSLTVAYWRL